MMEQSSSPQQTRSWQEEINGVFGNTLIPVANIKVEENTSLYDRTNGAIAKQRVTFIIERRNRKEIHLQVFDPEVDLRCMYPSCNTTKYWFTRWFNPCSDGSTNYKRFLCTAHVKKMDMYLQEICKENEVFIRSRHFINGGEDLMTLCGLIHNASCQEQILHLVIHDREKTRLIRDMFLNVRNYLIILHSLIDLDGDILRVLPVPYIMDIIMTIVKTMHMDEQPIVKLVHTVQQIIEKTLFFYGIIYSWQSLYVENNPYNQIGAGIGGMAGVISTIVNGSAVAGLAAMVILSRFGGAAGNAWYRENRTREMMEESLCQYQSFRRLHEVQKDQVYTWKMCTVALLVAILAVQMSYLFVKQKN